MPDSTKGTKKGLFLKSYRNNMGNVTKACKAVNIGRQTYYNWIEKSNEFKQEMEDIDEGFIDMAECALRKNIKKRMQRAVEFYLCNKKKSNYSNTIKGELSGPDGGPLSIRLVELVYKKDLPEKAKSG